MSFDVRTAELADHEAIRRLRRHAFGDDLSRADDPQAPQVPDERRLVAEADGQLIGHLGVWELGHWLARRRVPTGGLSSVVIDPAWRGRGVGSALIRTALDEMRARGEALATLYPLTRAVYRHFGWEIAGERPEWRVDITALDALPPADDVELAPGSPADVPAMAALEARTARSIHGMLDRPETFAHWALSPDPKHATYLARRDGELVGYVVYAHEPSDDPHALFSLRVREMVTTDADAHRGLWRLLGAHASGARAVRAVGPPAEPLELSLPERALALEPTSWRWMTRVLDLPAAIHARGWPTSVSARLELEVADPVLSDNEGRWVLTVADGRASLERGGTGRIRLDIGAMASLLTSWASPATLLAAGRLRTDSPDDLVALHTVLAGPVPWIRDSF